MISTTQAEAIIKSAQLKAKDLGIGASIAILDSGGNLKSFLRMDSAWLGSIDLAIKKAKTSILFEMETQSLGEYSKPDAPAHGIELSNDGLITFAGGIPIFTPDHRLLGAIGVSGGMVEQDYAIATAGNAALNIAVGK